MSDKILLKDRVFKKKIPESYSHPIDEAIHLITVPEEKYIAYGSSVFKSLQYAGDIDLMQVFKTFNSEKVIKALQQIIKKIQKNNGYITDIKCGLDSRFIIRELGNIKKGHIIGLKVDDVEDKLKELYKKKLMTTTEFNKYSKLLYSSSIKDYLELVEDLRLKAVLRWTPEEVLKGHKKHDNHIIYIKDAINHKSLTKIDLFTIINNKFSEFTNVLVYFFKDQKTKKVEYSAAIGGEDFRDNLKFAAFDLFNSKEPNYLKGFKRIYTIARIEKDYETLKKIYPLLISNINLLNKGKGDINAILTVLKYYNIPIDLIKQNLDVIKTELSNIADFDFDEKKIDKTFDDIYNDKIKKDKIADTLKELTKKMQIVINNETLKYIKIHNIDMKKIEDKYFP